MMPVLKINFKKSFSTLQWLLLLFIALCQQKAYATHSAGADIKYKYISGNQYEITVTFYRDCGGVAEPNTVTVNCKSQNGNYNFNVTANKVVSNNGQEITFPCSTNATTCNGGVTTGIKKWIYNTIVTLPSQQSDWTFSYSICCRNCSITTISNPCSSTSVLYVEAKLNNLISINNSSPDFTNSPIAFVCLGQNFNYNHGVVEPDGDSLFYELITPKTGSNSSVSFIPPTSVTNPVSSSSPFNINSSNGDINFTPNQMQIGVMAIRVKEFRNGQMIGSVIRDMQIYTQICTNNLPTLSGINGGNNFTTSVCSNQQICFNINSLDLDSNQSVTLTCNNGIPTASYNITAGNRPSLNFCWTPTSADISNIPHTFTITVKDNACPTNGVQTFSYSILVNGPQFILASSNNSCTGISGAQIAVVTNGNFTYLWNNGSTNSIITNLTSGSYSVTATDQNGCTSNQTLQLTTNGIGLTSTIIHPSCNGLNNGAIQLHVAGGTAPYNYNWSNGMLNKDIQQLSAGNYTVTVTDANGCSSTLSNQLAYSSNLSISSSYGNIDCFGSNTGWINTSATGGNSPYAVLWNNGLTQGSINNLYAGNYAVTYTDALGCSIQSSFTLTNSNDSLQVDFVTSDVKCYGDSSGSIITIVTGGHAPYTYHWNNNSTNDSINNIPKGVYTIIVTDTNNCAVTKSVSISQPLAPVQITASIYDVACKGDSSGMIEVFTSGGLGNYFYQWNNNSTTNKITLLAAGQYQVVVRDQNGCSTIGNFIIHEPDSVLQLTLTNNNSPCSSNTSNSISASATGGISPYSYLWSNGELTSSISNINSGIYSLTITDHNGCKINQSISTTNSFTPLTLSASSSNINCLVNQSGSINVLVSGGKAPYTYLWSNGSTNIAPSNITAGTYTVTVTDANGCTSTLVKQIIDETSFHAQVLGNNEICIGTYATLHIDTVANATYQWYYNNEALNGATSPEFITPVGGTYYVVITTPCGQYSSNNIEIVVHSLNHVQINNDVIICTGESTQLHAAGGVNYSWTPAINIDNVNFSDPVVSPTTSTDYTVTITDQFGCSSNATVKVSVMCDSLDVPNGFSPNNDGINDYFHIKGIDDFEGNVVFIYNRWGNLVYKQKNYDNKWDGKCNVNGALMGQDLPEGTYYFLIDLNNEGKPINGYVVLKR